MRKINDVQPIKNCHFKFFVHMVYEQFNFHFNHNHSSLQVSFMLSQKFHLSACHLDPLHCFQSGHWCQKLCHLCWYLSLGFYDQAGGVNLVGFLWSTANPGGLEICPPLACWNYFQRSFLTFVCLVILRSNEVGFQVDNSWIEDLELKITPN